MNCEETGMWKAVFVSYFNAISQHLRGSSEAEHKILSHGSYYEALFANETYKSNLDSFPPNLCYNCSNSTPRTCSDNPLKV
jgi:hypothetical protein